MNTLPSFTELGVAEPLCRALAQKNFREPTPIQARAIPILLTRRDVLGIAQTGTGKTAAFALPLLQNLATPKSGGGPRALILAPTRELAIQIGADIAAFSRHTGIRHTVIFGGVSQNPQVAALRRGVDIVVATPGRLLDLMEQGHARLSAVTALVLDEADRMLDMGFIRDIRKILAKVPAKRHTLLFSATMQGEVAKLASEILHDPVRIDIAPGQPTVERIEQKVYFVETAGKNALLGRLLADRAFSRVILFTRTKHRANQVATTLGKIGVAAEAIHGNKSQGARQRALESFRKGAVRVLVATDIAARGLDVADISHVINFDIPIEPESYVHRIGRTARNHADGVALSFCDASEYAELRAIERLTGRPIEVAGGTPPLRPVAAAQKKRSPARKQSRRWNGRARRAA